MKTLTLTAARNQLLKLADEIERNPETVVEVVKRGKRVMALISAEVYDALVETLEVLRDPTTLPKIREALKEIERGKGIPWKVARNSLELEG